MMKLTFVNSNQLTHHNDRHGQRVLVRQLASRAFMWFTIALGILTQLASVGLAPAAAKEPKTILEGVTACKKWCDEHNRTEKSRQECKDNCERYWACNGSDSTPKICKAVLTVMPLPASTAMPQPVLRFMGWEDYQIAGSPWVRFKLSVLNRSDFDPALFAPAPNLPPCGANANASRAWIAVHDFNRPKSEQIYGFCALRSNNDLGALWFAAPRNRRPAWQVFITIDDRLTHNVASSNVVSISRPTSPAPRPGPAPVAEVNP